MDSFGNVQIKKTTTTRTRFSPPFGRASLGTVKKPAREVGGWVSFFTSSCPTRIRIVARSDFLENHSIFFDVGGVKCLSSY